MAGAQHPSDMVAQHDIAVGLLNLPVQPPLIGEESFTRMQLGVMYGDDIAGTGPADRRQHERVPQVLHGAEHEIDIVLFKIVLECAADLPDARERHDGGTGIAVGVDIKPWQVQCLEFGVEVAVARSRQVNVELFTLREFPRHFQAVMGSPAPPSPIPDQQVPLPVFRCLSLVSADHSIRPSLSSISGLATHGGPAGYRPRSGQAGSGYRS